MASPASATAHTQPQREPVPPPGHRAALLGRPSLLAPAALLVLLAGAAAFLLHATRGTTFWLDEWIWISGRQANTAGTLLDPHNGHLSLVPVLIYRALWATAGLDHYGPYRVLVIASHLVCVALVYRYAARRVGSATGLLAATLILFLGPAWQDVIWPFQVAWTLSVSAGVGALLLLDRRTRRADVLAAVLLALSIASTGLGLAVAVGVAVDVLLGRRRGRDAWIFLAPLAAYAVWWVGYGDTQWQEAARAAGSSHPLLDGLLGAPEFVASSAAASLSALVGLGGPSAVDPTGNGTLLTFGPPLALIAAGLLAWRVRALGGLSPRTLALLAIAVSFWASTAVTRGFISAPTTSRYLYVGGVFLVLAAVELARGSSLRGWPLAVAAAVVGAIVVSNVGTYRSGAAYLRAQAARTRADVGAVALARPPAAPDFRLAGIIGLSAGPLSAAEARWGSDGASPGEIAGAPEDARKLADLELIRISGAALVAGPPGAPTGSAPHVARAAGMTATTQGSCVVLRPTPVVVAAAGRRVALALGPGGLAVSAQGGPVDAGLRRFAADDQAVGRVQPGATASVRIQADAARQPWYLDLTPTAGVTVCGQG